MSSYHFINSDQCRPQGSEPIEYELEMRQNPERAKVCNPNKEKERRPVDPPPIIQLRIKNAGLDPCKNYLQSPHLFVCVDLCSANGPQETIHDALAGTTVSSLYRLKDKNDEDGGFFVFGDLSVKQEGAFCLRFYLFEVQGGDVTYLTSVTSEPFTVYSAKAFPGMRDSTFLSRFFSDQGVRIRIRKEHRIKMKRTTQRLIDPPEAQSQFAVVQHHHYPPQNQTPHPNAPQVPLYEDRQGADHHYAGVPVRSHPPRHEYHPYQRGQYSYYEDHFYADTVNPWRPLYGTPMSGAEYPAPPSYPPGAADYQYPPYPDRREYPTRPPSYYTGDPHSPYPIDPIRRPEYMPELRRETQPSNFYVPPLPPRLHRPSTPPPPHRYYPDTFNPAHYDSARRGPAFQPDWASTARYSSERQDARQDTHPSYKESRTVRSPHSGSRPGSVASSMDRSTPLEGEPTSRGTLNGTGRAIESQGVHRQDGRSSNPSSVWQLVSTGGEEKH